MVATNVVSRATLAPRARRRLLRVAPGAPGACGAPAESSTWPAAGHWLQGDFVWLPLRTHGVVNFGIAHPDPHQPISGTQANNILRRRLAAAGEAHPEQYHMRDLRHTFSRKYLAAGGDNVVLDSIAFTATTRIADTATAVFVWSCGQLLSNWNATTALVRDKAKDASGEFDGVQATGSLTAATALAEQLGIVSRPDAVQIVNKISAALLSDLPRFHGLWPHWTKASPEGTPTIAWGTEWSSIDTVIATLGLLTAQQALGLETTGTEDLLREIDWDDLTQPGGMIAMGYDYDGVRLASAWGIFGGETWIVELAYASANRKVAPMTYPTPPTANGSGFIDELAWLFVPPPSGPDYWGTDWSAYRSTAAARQIRYYPANYPASCFAQLDLFGLSAAEVPDPSLVAPADIYQVFGLGGRLAGPNDGSALLGGAQVVIPHEAGLIASLRPAGAIRMWAWLGENGLVTPLNNVESLLFPSGAACDSAGVVWNELKGSWNLALQTLGWGRYLAERRGQVSVLWQATLANAFLREGYLLLAPGGPV